MSFLKKQILNGKVVLLSCAFLFLFQILSAQKRELIGNIEISDTAIARVFSSFKRYLKNEYTNFNHSDYFIGITISDLMNDSTQIELTITNYRMAKPQIKRFSGYYGFLKEDSIYFIFWNKSSGIKKRKKVRSPNIFEKVQTLPISTPYDPYSWQIILFHNSIISKFPEETIQKYLN